MNTFVSQNILKCAGLTVLCMCLGARAENQPATSTKAACVAPKAVFVNEVEVGADPFFPSSKRRLDTLPRVVVTNSVASPSALWSLLSLKGISGPEGQRLALINGATVAVGETAEIKYGGGQVLRARCREIRDRSVILELNGETRELKLREGVY
jgi:hypothetical protein